jgi:hypothetical protein
MRRILFCLVLLAVVSGQGCPGDSFSGLLQEYGYGGFGGMGGGYYSDYGYSGGYGYSSPPVYYSTPAYDPYAYYDYSGYDYGYGCGYYQDGCW